eukprot:665593-Rhodomonas_salina.1
MMSAVSFSSIPACALSQKNTVFSVCSAHNPTAVIRGVLPSCHALQECFRVAPGGPTKSLSALCRSSASLIPPPSTSYASARPSTPIPSSSQS